MTTETYHPHLIPQDRFIEFITAGKATFTLKSTSTGSWFTYKSEYVEQFGEKKLVIRLLNGSDNESSYTYLCTIKLVNELPMILRERSKISATAKSFVIFDMVFYRLLCRMPFNNLEIWHEGRCRRCGRKLTVPESIEAGVGPECAGRSNMFQL